MNRVKERRTRSGYSQADLAARLHVNQTAVSQWERGLTTPSASTLIKVCEILGATSDYLLGVSPQSAPPKGVRIPVLGRVPAGIPIEAVEEILDYEEIDLATAAHGPFFALQVKGDSMSPEYIEGDIVIVFQTCQAETGDDVVAYVNGYDATLKRFSGDENKIVLRPINPAYEPLVFTRQEQAQCQVKIAGVVVELRRPKKRI